MSDIKIPIGLYAFQSGSWESFKVAVRGGADYLISETPSIKDKLDIKAMVDALWLAERVINAIGVNDDWIMIFFDGEKTYSSDEVMRIYEAVQSS
ncbi:hypothetical protein [Aeromonas salmonicida]|uniref:hypothetical protein n=1 Tax=Aeromonas salmonicida TaxID=645 RepID=UPI000B403EEA|nr:hypothetical protein [Aeromonas salmonicida]ARW85443.1 hypothetical protein O23A_P4p0075 [Aeromonas salmonicida]